MLELNEFGMFLGCAVMILLAAVVFAVWLRKEGALGKALRKEPDTTEGSANSTSGGAP